MNETLKTILMASLLASAGPHSDWAAENSVDWLNRTDRENRAKRSAPLPAVGKSMTAPMSRRLPPKTESQDQR
jgi:hypothetical protein